ncbi:Hypothetical protein NTJ_05944 [Nesidiocoris tenuis]|uniref:Uncharacterized protein n=1 Tax=Nesidiocoris tenuis TaxID=355587 RepID=A0ABN7APD5_9HEMI|nr:Hypothetical protein NTJ_05944 [Nesidiocoris tenuis]
MQRCGCYMPMPYYSPQMPQPAAPSYCVQSVVVGGKAVAPEKSGEENAGGTQESPAGGNPGNPAGGNPGNTTGFGGGGLLGGGGGLLGGGGLGAPPGRLGPGGLALDPGRQRLRDPSLNLGGGGLGGLPPALRAALPHLLEGLRIPGLGGLGGGVAKYENYLEKILDAINDKLEPSCVGPSPMVVMPQTCTPRVRVKKVRRKQRRKYMIESCEEPDVIVEEEEEDRPSYVLAAPFCPSRSCCCRPRRCGCRSCCY